jgi:hypothetical protein
MISVVCRRTPPPGEALVDTRVVRRWVATRTIEAQRSFRRLTGHRDVPVHAAALHAEVARRLADSSDPFTSPGCHPVEAAAA